ncbi:MAG: hypothetical protein F6K16_34900 [Symploca sp. SIO2B6]|nr:hypothetical protein [Symploca sp. SIO2B6]
MLKNKMRALSQFVRNAGPTDTASGTYEINLTATDTAAASVSDTFTFTVLNAVNTAPITVTLSNTVIDENVEAGFVVGELTAIDEDVADTHSFTLVDDAGGTFIIEGNTVVVAEGAILDFEADNSFDIVVQAKDSADTSVEQVLTISLNDIEESPDNTTDTELIIGTQGDDNNIELTPAPGFQIVATGSGNDTIKAKPPGSPAKDRFYGGSDDDELIAGTNDRLFGGSGNDTLDASQGGGGNRLYGGEGEDELIAGENDRLFGGSGNDTLEASTEGSNNRIYGGDGDDDFFLGNSDEITGGEGSDRFFVGTGGSNTITGNIGADQFWIANAEIPDFANTITDFTAGEDVLGIAGITGVTSIENLNLTQNATNTVISISGKQVAILQGIQNSSLTEADFVFS